jgi:signal transduction histidine kinase
VSAVAARLPAALAGLTRRSREGVLAGVCAGLARSARVDATLVRLVFAFLALAGGAGVLAYAAAWVALPEEGGPMPGRASRVVGVALLGLAAVLALWGLGVGDLIVWAVLIVAGGVLFALRRSPATPGTSAVRAAAATVLVVAGALLVVDSSDEGRRGALVAPAGLALALVLVVGPWVWRMARERDAERLERIRAQERADLAARVHDSVLQTLALVQREAGDPKRVAALARRQERELRGWLYGDRGQEGNMLGRALEDALADVEELHGVRVELVQIGDCPLDERLRSVVLAAREAVANAAVHAGVSEVSVYAEVVDGDVTVFVRDRGQGFERATVPEDRRGIADSIEARMVRHGGTAVVRSTVGEGTEVELRMPPESPG